VTPPTPGGPGWQPPAPGAERQDDRPAWLRQPATGWSPTPPPEPPPRRVGRLTSALILLLVIGLAAGGLVVATRREDPAGATATGGTAAGGPGTGAPARPTPGSRGSGAAAVPAEVQAVQRAVTELRGLSFKRKVPVTVESPERLSRRLLRIQAAELDEAGLRRQGRAMELLGQLPPGSDLARLLNRVRAESALGFYLPGRAPKGRLYVGSTRGLDPFARYVLAHELTHAATDQHYDLTRTDRLAAATGREDELAAYSALLEGDASLVMQRYVLERLTPAEQADLALAAARRGNQGRQDAPPVLRESLLFPYQEGLRFVRTLYQRGGWAAVDRAYRDPPTSTEQVLHPERYLGDRDQPRTVAVPDLSGRLGAGWRPGAEVGFGEFDARLLLQGELAVAAAEAAAAGWDGGRLRTFQRGDATALALRTVWDSGAEAEQFCAAMRGWAGARFGAATRSGPALSFTGAGQRAALVCRGPRVAWLSAPDRPTLGRLTAALGGP
jgi:hypothetical protein